jgi:holliday junction DNA helicase RuvA
MIVFLRGRVTYSGVDYVALDVNGVGYQVRVTDAVRWGEGEDILLYTHYIVREDAHLLYGFPTIAERDLFRLLLEVSGIGPKAGMAMLAGGTPSQLVEAIQTEDLPFLTRLPGIGKKTAQRMVLDLKEKVKRWDKSTIPSSQKEVRLAPSEPGERDVIDALVGLGYNEEEAEWAAREALPTSDSQTLVTEEWIKRALQISMRR